MADSNFTASARAHSDASHTPALPPLVRAALKGIYSAVALSITTLDAQAADSDIDAARVLKNSALGPLNAILWTEKRVEGSEPKTVEAGSIATASAPRRELRERFEEMERRLYLVKNVLVMAVSHARMRHEEDIDLWSPLQEMIDIVEQEADWLSQTQLDHILPEHAMEGEEPGADASAEATAEATNTGEEAPAAELPKLVDGDTVRDIADKLIDGCIGLVALSNEREDSSIEDCLGGIRALSEYLDGLAVRLARVAAGGAA